MADAAKVVSDALSLNREERTTVILRLLESLDGEPETGVEEAWEVEVARRVGEIKNGNSNSEPLDVALAELDQIVDE